MDCCAEESFFGGCVPWPLNTSCCSDWESYSEEDQCRASILAWSALKALTGGRVGSCPVTIRPCQPHKCQQCETDWLVATPYLQDMPYLSPYYRPCVPTCSCEPMCEVVLPGEVACVNSVLIDGSPMPDYLYRLDVSNRLVRVDGNCWPACQPMSKPLTEPGTFAVVYTPGVYPDSAVSYAAGTLACEFVKICSDASSGGGGGGRCRLPSSVTSVVRQGVSMTFGAGEAFPGGMTGIREVDVVIMTLNPHGLKKPPQVWSPDLVSSQHRFVRSIP